MRTLLRIGLTVATLAAPLAAPYEARAQRRERQTEAEFVASKPTVGDPLPAVVVYDVDGREVTTGSLRGHYTVLNFGCLT